ncbi:MAG: SDR family NAD(P)-dependent oxidoreductase [candidate division WOR-3 bacterium]|nr:SDR family NAD(P)-dependent oxidoreductase [candidate division WOR-3 bacterium]MCX7947563.1 SDR family NAD(P)-dependent oxidoreductase [candidate division WOR-3 bacterium]MDW8150448.1 SDR family NAD(P)-dependent oxidoreductase [candidate division WOR-3 bacterium]
MKSAIITGASSGIGKAIAYELAKEKYELLLIARRENLLNEICEDIRNKFKTKVNYLIIDLSNRNSNFSFIKDYFLENYDNLNILVNNAGIGYYGEIENLRMEDIERLFWTNLFSHILITKDLVDIMKKQGFGTIVNIISLIAFFPIKKWSLYASTKSAQMGFFKSLRRELYRNRIRVINVYPSATETEFFNNLNLPYRFPQLDKPEKVAKKVVKFIKKNKNAEVFISPLHWLAHKLSVWF